MKANENPWMYVSVLLGVLLVVAVSLNFMTYQTLSKALSGGSLGGSPSGGNQAPIVVPPPSQPAAPSGPVQVDLSGTYSRGPANAKVTIVEYSDFQCPFCSRSYPTMKAVLQKYGNDVRLVYKHFPLSFHPEATPAAEASECAGEQNKFWEFHDKVFENQDSMSVANYKKWAGELGLKQAQFDQCADSRKYKSKVEQQTQQGQADGVSGTPTFYINGQQIVGAQPQSVFEQAIDAVLKQ
ncbi:MAG TPA: DsbA family protein [Candidatus Nanoarchaeia archaeon]|nr:DsbA family protein [Candidatus Nanoarchaeia archaeon]